MFPEGFHKKYNTSEKGKKCAAALYKKMAENGTSFEGENNPNWKGGISKNFYHYKLIQKQRYPERVHARQIVCDMLRRGKILRQPCSICGDDKSVAHHEDYTYPEQIIWLWRRNEINKV